MMIMRLGQRRLTPCSVSLSAASKDYPLVFCLTASFWVALLSLLLELLMLFWMSPMRTLQQLAPPSHPAAFVRFSRALREPSTRPEG